MSSTSSFIVSGFGTTVQVVFPQSETWVRHGKQNPLFQVDKKTQIHSSPVASLLVLLQPVILNPAAVCPVAAAPGTASMLSPKKQNSHRRSPGSKGRLGAEHHTHRRQKALCLKPWSTCVWERHAYVRGFCGVSSVEHVDSKASSQNTDAATIGVIHQWTYTRRVRPRAIEKISTISQLQFGWVRRCKKGAGAGSAAAPPPPTRDETEVDVVKSAGVVPLSSSGEAN